MDVLALVNDEERSEMRYVMRIAELSESSNFERTLHFLVSEKYFCLSVCSYSLTVTVSFLWPDVGDLVTGMWFKNLLLNLKSVAILRLKQ